MDGLKQISLRPPPAADLQRAYALAALSIGLLRTTTIQLVGAMPIGEFVLLLICLHAGLALALTQRLPAPVPAPRLISLFILSQAVALASYMLTDLWRESGNMDMLRGWLRMIFVLIDLCALAILFGANERAFVWLQAGTALSFAQLLIEPPLFGEYWKFGFAYPTTVLVLLIAPRLFGFWGAIGGSLAMGSIHALLDFRSLGAECIVIGAMLLLRTLPKARRKALIIVGTLACIAASPVIFDKMFSNTGARANRSNVERSAMLQAAWEGFNASPLLGQGSWFSRSQVMDQFLLIRAEKARAAGGGMHFSDKEFEGIAIHSQILVSLAEGGLFAGSFFIFYGALLLWAMWFALTDASWNTTLPCRFFILVVSFFNLWMSPFSGPIRIEIATAAVLIATFWRERLQRHTTSFQGTDHQNFVLGLPDPAR